MGKSNRGSGSFVSEAIDPAADTFDVRAMSAGEPGLPARFRWRESEYEVARVVEKWKTTGDCRHGSDEQYVRRHWFRVETSGGDEMLIYFDRQPKSRNVKKRWWLASVKKGAP